MGLEKFNPALAIHDLIQDLKWSAALREEFATNEAAVLKKKFAELRAASPATTSVK